MNNIERVVKLPSSQSADTAVHGAPGLPEYDSADVARHNSQQSCWVVIDGLIYDVTHFQHPGGNHRLLDNAGTDVSTTFKAIRHSSAAYRQLDRFLVGRLVSRQLRPPGPAEALPELLPLSQDARDERRALKAGSIHRKVRPDESVWCTRPRGFLPARDPLTELDEPYKVLLELVARMPTALAEGTFRRTVQAEAGRFAPLAAAIAAEPSLEVLERVHGLYGYIGKGYVHGVLSDADGAQSVPPFLAEGWLAASNRVGRHPTIDYANCVLYNWERIEEHAPLTPENIRLLNRFTGLLDEEWFLKTHVIIESEAAGVVSSIYDACNAIQHADYDRLLAMLGWLEQSMSHVATNCLWIMFERSEDEGFLCEPDFFFHRFRPYISSWTALFEGQYENTERLTALREELAMVERLAASSSELPSLAAHRKHLTASIHQLQARKRLAGPSGAMSTLLPLCDAFCDIRMSSAELGKMLEQFETYAPVEHRELLALVRQCPARPVILDLARSGHAQAATLVDHFNAVVRRVLDFRWRHLSYIEQYVLKPSGEAGARGTGGTPAFAYLNQHISDTEAALISEIFSRRPSSEVFDDDDDDDDDAADAKLGGAPSKQGSLRPSPRPSQTSPCFAPPPLWDVSDAHGLLPSRHPLESAAMPATWQPVLRLAEAVPRACVPPPTFRAHVLSALPLLPRNCEALTDESQRERGRCLLAFIVAGWHAGGVEATTPRVGRGGVAHPEPPEALSQLFEEASAAVCRAPRLGLVDLVLYNWRVAPGLGAARADSVDEGDEHAMAAEAAEAAEAVAEEEAAADDAPPPLQAQPSPSDDAEPHANGHSSHAAGAPPLGRAHHRLLSAVTRPGLPTMGSVAPMLRFLCVEEEAWFCRLHVALAGEASREMSAVRKCLDARTTEQQVRALQQLEASLEVLVRVHYAAGIGQPIGQDGPKVKPDLLMHRLHRFLPYEPSMGLEAHEQRAARVYCATGIDQSCVLHLMGVVKGSHALQTFREWQESAGAMELPAAHREYLRECLTRPSIRDEVERAVGQRNLSVNDLSRLELAYNSCIDMMLRYFARRNELMRAMFGADTLKEAFDLERSGILAARLKLLVERRVSRMADGLMSTSSSLLALGSESHGYVVEEEHVE